METVQERKETKMSPAFREGKGIDLVGLWSEIGGSTSFGIDKVLSMASVCHDEKEDFLVNHSGTHYRVSWESLAEYFATHRKPEYKLDMKQENVMLKHRIENLEELIHSLSVGKEAQIPTQRKTGNAASDFLSTFKDRIGSASPASIETQLAKTLGEIDPGKMKAELRAQETAGAVDEGPTESEIEAAKRKGPISAEQGAQDAKDLIEGKKPNLNPL